MGRPRATFTSILVLGCTTLLWADSPDPPKLTMTPAVICAKINGYGDYVRLDEPVLSRDEKMLVYYETSGHAHEIVGKEYRVHLVQDGRIRRKGEKKVLQAKDKLVDYKGKSKQPPLNIFLTNTIALKDLAPGEYELEIVLHDELSKGTTASQLLRFRVKAASPDDPGKTDGKAR
ncbi:MAG: hypothetical protein JWN86_2783 [Planctomycetota bacterium]|nr:hypothetical protein [Planctomycetota bacterium]